MKICVAQTRPIKGNIQRNIENHTKLIDLALANRADTIIFPELSITGYEPELANELATTPEDSRFDVFQKISDIRQITIGIGVPTKNSTGIYISLVLFAPHKARQTYSKKYLHGDEEPFFSSGQNDTGTLIHQTSVALAICYEISVPKHAQDAFASGAKVYVASVAKSVTGIAKALETLATTASTYSMTVLMANCIGYCDNFECGGKTSIWNSGGALLGQLDDVREGILMIDTETEEIIEKML